MNHRKLSPANIDVLEVMSIISAVSSVWGVEPEIILGRSRRHPGAFARQLCMALAYQRTHLSLNQVGQCFDNRDHGTVLYAIKKVDQESSKQPIKGLILKVISQMQIKENIAR